ncbi:MAG: FMN phosphatase YigB (HAD superfamily), partial [Pseudomonadales bacterium]
MSVYVDNCKHPFHRAGEEMLMCHMVADSLEELHAMADEIGMQRRWFQDKPRHPHYDLTEHRRLQAVQLGA